MDVATIISRHPIFDLNFQESDKPALGAAGGYAEPSPAVQVDSTSKELSPETSFVGTCNRCIMSWVYIQFLNNELKDITTIPWQLEKGPKE